MFKTKTSDGQNGALGRVATVFVVDDDPDVRRSIDLLCRSVDLGVELYQSAHDFLNAYTTDRPGCLVLDVKMPEMTGLELQQELGRRDIQIPIIIITAFGDVPLATHAMRSGAIDFLQKPYSPQILLERIHEAIHLDATKRSERIEFDKIAHLTATLSCREKEVMELLTAAWSTKRIASHLGISIKTVDNHRASILAKMNVESIPELMRQTRVH